MASHPPGACCATGFKHEGTPQGTLGKIGQTTTYFAVPTDGNKTDIAIIYLSDIFGLSNNSKLLADEFARQGYHTIIPDILHGDGLDFDTFQNNKIDMEKWDSRHGPETVDHVVDETIDYIRNKLGVTKIGAVGYCFGGKYVARFLKPGKLDSGYTAHPSFVTNKELSAVQKPFSIAAAEIDPIFPRDKRYESEEILIKTKQKFQINLFNGVSHGFAVRGDLSVPENKFAKEAAFYQAVAWFNYTLRL